MIRIAAVSSKESMKDITKYADDFEDIEIIPFIYHSPLESIDAVEQITDCEAVLFGGQLPYMVSKHILDKKPWPAVYVPSDEHALMASLFYTSLHKTKGIKRLSMDIYHKNYATQVAQFMNIPMHNWYVMDYQKFISDSHIDVDTNEIITFHKNLYEQGKTDYAITSMDLIYSTLTSMEIPVQQIIMPEKSILDALEKAITYGKLGISRHAELTVGYITLHHTDEDTQSRSQEQITQDTTVYLQQHLLELMEDAEASAHLIDLNKFIVYATKGSIEQLLHGELLHSFLQSVNQFPNMTVSIGFGFGNTAKESENHANTALFYAEKDPNNSKVFIVTASKEVIGPLYKNSKTFSLQSQDQSILHIADRTNTSVATVTKLMQFIRIRKDPSFSSAELAEYLNISRRTSERLIKRFLDTRVFEKVGEEQPYKQGRPRAVYKMITNNPTENM